MKTIIHLDALEVHAKSSRYRSLGLETAEAVAAVGLDLGKLHDQPGTSTELEA